MSHQNIISGPYLHQLDSYIPVPGSPMIDAGDTIPVYYDLYLPQDRVN